VLTYIDLLADKLGNINLIISALGLLIIREHIDKLFPSFSNKDITLPLVIVTSTKENTPIATTLAALNRSTKHKAGPSNLCTRSVR
jgi:hypothetical protein